LNCKEALRLLYDVIDKEADQLDAVEVEKHLRKCRHCMKRYEFEEMFRAFVTDKGHNSRDNGELRHRILGKLDAIDAAGEVGLPRRPFRVVSLMVASAAAVIIVIVGAYWVNQSLRTSAELTPFVEAHFASQTNPVHGTGTTPFDYLYEQTGIYLVPSRSCPIERIHAASVDTIRGIQFGRLEFLCDDGSMVTLFVTTADKYTLPDRPTETVAGRRLLVRCNKECTLVGETRQDLVFMVVATPAHQPVELAQLTSSF